MSKWSEQHRHDHYYREAKKQGYRARSSFKLIQIHNRYSVFRTDDVVIDLGASPGGWSQVAANYARLVVAVDITPMKPIDKVVFLNGDITESITIQKIKENAPCANVVLSDASPNISGHYSMDQAKSVWLCENALKIACETLIVGGVFLCKIFEGEDYPEFVEQVKKHFYMVKPHNPKASRKQSSEIYILAKGFKKNEIN